MQSKPMLAAWEYFSALESYKKAICKSCNAEITKDGACAKSVSTSGLIYHLKAKHPELQDDYERRKVSQCSPSL